MLKVHSLISFEVITIMKITNVAIIPRSFLAAPGNSLFLLLSLAITDLLSAIIDYPEFSKIFYK